MLNVLNVYSVFHYFLALLSACNLARLRTCSSLFIACLAISRFRLYLVLTGEPSLVDADAGGCGSSNVAVPRDIVGSPLLMLVTDVVEMPDDDDVDVLVCIIGRRNTTVERVLLVKYQKKIWSRT